MSRRSWAESAIAALCCLWIACLTAGVAGAETPRSAPVIAPQAVAASAVGASSAGRAERRRAAEARFRKLATLRSAIAVAGLAVYGVGVWLRRRGRADDWYGARQALLALLAVSAFAAYYNFFQLHHPGGFKSGDFYHYYMGSKYFDELGYFELYPCTLAAAVEQELQAPTALPEVRNQRTLRLESAAATRKAMTRCPERFSTSRWAEFRRDVAFFRPRLQGGNWANALSDHGYNPTPVWSFVGGLVSKNVPARSNSLPTLVAIDRALIVVMGALIAWAFGLEAACLAAIVWGTSPLWGYSWTGDAFLRHLWLFSAVSGLCLLERGRQFGAGAWLTAAALLRVFPGVFVAGYLAHVAMRLRREGLSAETKRFVAGVALSGAVLLAGGAIATGHGVSVYFEFGEKMSGVVGQPGVNKVGLSALANHIVYRATTVEVANPDGRIVKVAGSAPLTVASVRSLQALIVLVGLVAYWLSLRRVTEVEAVLLAFALIPLLTSPTNYYYPFVVGAAMLSPRHPWAGVAVSGALLAWIATGQIWMLESTRFIAWDVVAVVLSLTVLVGMALRSRSPESAASALQSAPTTP